MGFLSQLFGNDKPKRRPPTVIFPPNSGDIQDPTQGILIHADELIERPRINVQIPPIGPFTFPHPYNTQACRLTHAGQDVNYVGYSYWNNINNHYSKHFLNIVLSINNGLTLLTLEKSNFDILATKDLNINHTGEGIYFSKENPNWLYIPIDNQLIRLNVESLVLEVVWEVSEGKTLWQVHTSNNDQGHSATLRDSNYQPLKWVTSFGHEIDIEGAADECQISKDHKSLVVKEGADVRIINLEAGAEFTLFDSSGAPGHSDNGMDYVIGEDDHFPMAGALCRFECRNGARTIVFHTNNWNLGHVSHCNAPEPKCLLSTDLFGNGNIELVSVKLDQTGRALVICPSMTESTSYENQPKANICPVGEFAIWTAWINGRRDAFIVRIPRW